MWNPKTRLKNEINEHLYVEVPCLEALKISGPMQAKVKNAPNDRREVCHMPLLQCSLFSTLEDFLLPNSHL